MQPLRTQIQVKLQSHKEQKPLRHAKMSELPQVCPRVIHKGFAQNKNACYNGIKIIRGLMKRTQNNLANKTNSN